MIDKIKEKCPNISDDCLATLQKHCPSLDQNCLDSLTQMDYYLVGRENFNLSIDEVEQIKKCMQCGGNTNADKPKKQIIGTTKYGEEGYLELLYYILNYGEFRGNRTGVNTRSVFHSSLAFDLEKGFPALTTKKLFWNGVIGELLWFLSGKNDLNSLRKFTYGEDLGQKTIWDIDFSRWNSARNRDNNESGGNIYGVQWRRFSSAYANGIYTDQIRDLLEEAKINPTSRRLVLNAWNSADIKNDNMALPPCHMAFQLYIENGHVNLKWTQRSVDCFLGLPFNIASYAMLTHIFAHWLDLKVGWLVADLTNVHIYESHVDAVKEQLNREPLQLCEAPIIPKGFTLEKINSFTAKDFPLIDYQSHPRISAPMEG